MPVPEKAFVNLFWGHKDDGFAAIQMKIKTSLRTVHELLNFYKEKIAIEKDYNKRLSKLSSAMTLGSGETGSLKIALDKLQNESGNMIVQNQHFISSVLLQNYEKLHQFYQMYHKNTAKIESHMLKVLQKKKDLALYLETAKEKFRVACSQQKTLTLLCQTTWGKELEKNTARLHKVQLSLQVCETTYQQAVQKYAEIHGIWVRDWSISLLNIYQLEIERIQICKLNCFAFCNHVASLCVEWDLAVDNARSTFARIGAPKDVSDFVDGYGTGSRIPVPPVYVDFLNGYDDDDSPKFTVAEFKDPDYSHILSRTFSTHSTVISKTNGAENDPQQSTKPVAKKSPPPIEKPLPPTADQVSAKKNAASTLLNIPGGHAKKLGEALQKQPSHNSNYTSATEDVFDKQPHMHNSNTLSDYSLPTNYSGHTGRSWSSPRKRLPQDVQKEINRRLQDVSEAFAAPPATHKQEKRKSVPIAKDFLIDFIAKALEDLNAGGDGDMNRFRRSVRLESETAADHHAEPLPALDFVDDSTETARRFDSIKFRSPGSKLNSHTLPARSMPYTVTDDNSLDTVVKKAPANASPMQTRSLLQSPTKSYMNLLKIVAQMTPVTRNKYETKAVAKYNYVAREQGELSFKKGWHMFIIHKQEDNWYVCELGENCGKERGSVGLVPYNYIVEGDRVF
ncbi:hypothetical protein METBIDRAFT_35054 [Metschnikowia bicuspidata var. bicuspidata NRRL YB-4993]|uniref:FCH-domain-containing protein n=1 Tax=Metschnikowia bicuspidata var. bicuspidata NRRL YB-4993 TaxID=869754 RepID=A0A1A0HEZ5_9ASCO|nr:hypothetical protein METBIDRAFT_35054 [Metschnikowia bicuspidata var. bicuspidata NRRL YB-4993]OBA22694.1 hypothetical protein METBIDRAFT_35054 [Metschnikowia bicuspidata var. bicuspidata NRRL YB-4993]